MTEVNDPLMVLHKYYLAANLMRVHFEKELGNKDKGDVITNPDLNNLMCLWYGALFVVIEGWRELGWENEDIDKLLESDNVDLLRGCRNDTFHYQKKYYPNRYIKFISEADSATWVKNVNAYFGKFFLEEFEKRK